MTSTGDMETSDELDQRPDRRPVPVVASDSPSPGGGAVAALVVAQAAGVAAMAGRYSAGHSGSDAAPLSDLIADADRLREHAAQLADADADAEAYEAYLRAVRMSREHDPAGRAAAIATATSDAADVPLKTAGAAADVARIALVLVEHGNRNLRSDAAAAASLAASAATTAAIMVVENLAKTPDDPRIARAVDAAARARTHADKAIAAFGPVAAGVLP